MIIDRIAVTLEPWRFRETLDIELRIRVQSMGQEQNYAQMIRPQDLESYLDLYFERAKEEIKTALRKQAKINQEVTP